MKKIAQFTLLILSSPFLLLGFLFQWIVMQFHIGRGMFKDLAECICKKQERSPIANQAPNPR